MDTVLLDDLVLLFAFVFYGFLCVVYVLRARELSNWEWRLATIFSVQLAPFLALWVLNIYSANDSGRLLTLVPVIVYLVYDLWYRLLSRKKPYHHPEHWPPGLVVYLALLLVSSIGLNWYGYLVSQLCGSGLVVAFFVMMSCYGYYQRSYNKRHEMMDKNETATSQASADPLKTSLSYKLRDSVTEPCQPRQAPQPLSCGLEDRGRRLTRETSLDVMIWAEWGRF